MKIKILLIQITFFLIISSPVYSQDARITGGNQISGMICSNGDVYTWGKNDAGLTGSLGNGSASSPVTSPTRVLFPTNDPYFDGVLSQPVTMYSADAGSGQTFYAMDCYGGAWAWGFNNNATQGITGTGSAAAAVTTPARVLKGETPGGASIDASLASYLVGVVHIAGGNESGFAVLNDGTAVGWGENSFGQLGNGTTTDCPTPKYIRNPDGSILQGVIQVDAGDQTGYAIVDPDGDGIGTVYSFGGGSVRQLGRNAAATANGGAETGNDPWARPVIMSDGTALTNIVSIAASDVMCLAMDVSGYVYTWGNNGWGGATGTGFGGSHSDPKLVAAGEWGTTAGAGLGLPFLQAKSISAGQGFGMAVSIDGKPMAWGNNGACGSGAAGGNLGDGTGTSRSTPVFIKRGAGVVDDNIASISSGDTWGFYVTEDNEILAWGNNALGYLGIGNTTCQSYAVPMTPTCTLPDPTPIAQISPRDVGICPGSSQILNSGFTVSASLAASYSLTWERSTDNGVTWTPVQTSTAAVSTTYTASQEGLYKVTVLYTGINIPCAQPAMDSTEVSLYERPFTTGGTFCAPNGEFAAIDNLGYTGWYDWYDAASGGTNLNGNGNYTDTLNITLSQAVNNGDGTYTVWVVDSFGVEGAVRPNLPGSCTPGNRPSNNMQHKFTVNSTLTIESIMAMHYTNSNAGNWDQFRVIIYNGDATTTLGSVINSAQTYSSYLRGPVSTATAITLPVNVTLAPGTYWLEVQTTTSGYLKSYECAIIYPQNDNTGQNLLSITGTRQWGGASTLFGSTYNWKISRGEPYPCGRVPVTITENCPAPVKFLDFTASLSNGKGCLNWSTAMEKNNSYFAVQRSEDGVHFETIGYVKGAGTSEVMKEYHFIDTDPLSEISYYRIRQEDFDGQASYSVVRTLTNEASQVILYPNPFNHSFNILVHSSASSECRVAMIDVTGRLLSEETVPANQESTLGEELPPGMYLIKVYTDEELKVYKIKKLK